MANRKFRKNGAPKADRKRAQTGKDTDAATKSAVNDVSWYTRYPMLTAASASIPYPYRPGMQIKLAGTSWTFSSYEYKIPGVMRIRWLPSIGYSNSSTDPASLVARELWTRVRACFSGSLDADAPDFLIYLTCLDSIFSYIGMLKRLYRAISAYNPDNYSTPDVLLAALGVMDPGKRTYLMNHKVRLWQNINELIYMSRKFRCPGEFDIFNRHYWMQDHVYTDAPSVNSQMFVFECEGYYHYKTLNTPGGVPAAGAQIVSVNWNTTQTDFVDYLFTFGKSLIDDLSNWDDAYTINGYLERAFADSKYFVVDELEQNATLDLSYEPEVLTQIENARISGVGWDGYLRRQGFDISQDPLTNTVLYHPQLVVSSTTGWDVTRRISEYLPTFSIRSEQPTLVDTIVASRLSTALGVGDTSVTGEIAYDIICGTEIPVGIDIYYRDIYVSGGVTSKFLPQDVDGATSTVNSIVDIAAFDWHPQFYSWTGTIATNDVSVVPVFDVHNLTVCSKDQLYNIHRVCVLSEWNAFSV